ncbi:hypothetical protein HOK51_06530 [Candidatus Woesearchaeota archaeon]|jgi:metal-responsive CopG/Arc/MetJ family transcriptional regulator|nr:hypothetical protein [Candidatus Woesearchaeota archaeon]MBT6519480.1 hypothetical protein [Candidatus Woesearchaeota archaeon]MBT7368228.1 hypothetical protein [Candidatus Woesearchaeota archaeon]
MKDRITITIGKELLKYLDQKINQKIFANRSHALEFLIYQKIEDEKITKTKDKN